MRHEDDELRKGEEFIEQNRAKMIRIARAELRDKGCADPEGDAEDVINEVSIALLILWTTLRSPVDAMYVFTVNKARTHARSCRREFASEIRESQVPFFSQPSRDPDVVLEQLDLIERALSYLGEEEAQVVTMRLMHDMSYATIADRLGKPMGSVTSIYSRALTKMRKALKAEAPSVAVKRPMHAPES